MTATHNMARLRGRKQTGWGLLETIIVIGIVGGLLAYIVSNQTRADNGVAGNKLAEGTTTMVAGIKKRLVPSRTYAALSASWLNSNGLVVEPFTWDGTNVKDPFGNSVNLTGVTTTFALTIGGTEQVPQDVCSTFASTMAPNATNINLGAAATVSNGAVSGGTAYKTAANTDPVGTALSNCSATSNVIALQFR